MSVAERTREAVRERPFLLAALGAGVVNYSAAARWLDVDGDEESVATALRRYAADLDPPAPEDRRVSVRLDRAASADWLPADADVEDAATVRVSGEVDAGALERSLARLDAADVAVLAAHVTSEELAVVVPRRAGADALRIVEDELGAP